MKITELLERQKTLLSFEVFPPKAGQNFESVERAALEIATLKPAFMSVTYGAGGSAGQGTEALAMRLQNEVKVPALMHLTCVGAGREEMGERLKSLENAGIENVLALRGDRPEGFVPPPNAYRFAAELVADIKDISPRLCVGAACYPEGHVESPSRAADIAYLKEKVDAGADFLTTQMFFDNNILYNFLYKIRERGIMVPVAAGIMPVTNGRQIRTILRLSGQALPPRFQAIVDRFGGASSAMKQAGIVYACEQIVDLLANGIHMIHVYSMNKPDVAAKILQNLSEILSV